MPSSASRAPLRVLVAPDKFKGTLRAREAADALAEGWRRTRPQDHIDLLPITDGGDGFGELAGRALSAEWRTSPTVDAAHRDCQASWWWEAIECTAVIEAAVSNGLALLPQNAFHPFDLDTTGVGRLLSTVQAHGGRRCLIGVGGSATNDGGFGMARALGWDFIDDDGRPIQRWTDLHRLRRITPPATGTIFEQVTVAVDVQNPLLGDLGCTRVYGPQKGLKPADFAAAEACLEKLADVAKTGVDCAQAPGCGAAGGLAFGLCAFLGATLRPGFEVYANLVGLRARLESMDLVLTGEGRIDASTLMGKGTGELGALCRELKKPCIAIGGECSNALQEQELFTSILALSPDLTTREAAITEPARWLAHAASLAATQWPPLRRQLQGPQPGGRRTPGSGAQSRT